MHTKSNRKDGIRKEDLKLSVEQHTSDRYKTFPKRPCTASFLLNPFSVNPDMSMTTGPEQ